MKKIIFLLSLPLTALLIAAVPQLASAHAHNEFQIGGKTYHILVGSLNEPVAVDDKTAVDLRVEESVMNDGHHMDGMEMDHPELTKPASLTIRHMATPHNHRSPPA